MQWLRTLIFTAPDGRVYRGSTYSDSTLQGWLSQCRRDSCPMMVVTIESKSNPPKAWFMQTRGRDGTYTTRSW